MIVIVNHNIQDPDAFWSIVKKNEPIPSHLHLLSVYPSQNMLRSVCVWEAQSPEAVNEFLRNTFGNISKDELYEVNEKAAMGLPLMSGTA